MKNGKTLSFLALILSVMTSAVTESEAQSLSTPYDHLLVVRGQGGSIWKRFCSCAPCAGGCTCTRGCENWVQVPGATAQPPAVLWDKSIQAYVVYVVNEVGVPFTTTFDRNGAWSGSWTVLDGIVTAPVGGAGGDIQDASVVTQTANATPAIGLTCTNYAAIPPATGGSVTLTAPTAGTVVVEADVEVSINHPLNGTDHLVFVEIDTSPGLCDATPPEKAKAFVQSQDTTGIHARTVHVTRRFAVSAGTSTFYLNATAVREPTATSSFTSANMKAVFYP